MSNEQVPRNLFATQATSLRLNEPLWTGSGFAWVRGPWRNPLAPERSGSV